MVKKFFGIIIMVLLIKVASFGQTATVGAVEQASYSPGDYVTIPVTVTNLNHIWSISWNIAYNSSVLSFVSLTNINSQVSSGLVYNAMYQKVMVEYTANPPSSATITSGTIFKMKFIYLGGSCNFVWGTGCEVYNNLLQPVTITYTGGSISPFGGSASATINSVNNASFGESVPVVVSFSNLGVNIGAITLKIGFDETSLSFASVYGTGVFYSGVAGATQSNQITLTFSSPTGVDPDNGSFVMNFVYNGVGSTNLTFDPGCEIRATDLSLIQTTFNSGTVSALANPTAGTVSINNPVTTSIVTATLGEEIFVPVTFDYSTPGGYIGAFTFKIGYDDRELSYIGIIGNTINNVIGANNSNISITQNSISITSELTITWSSASNNTDISGDLFFIRFRYNGLGTANLQFRSGSSMTRTDLGNVNLTFNNGTIERTTPYEGTVTCGSIAACNGGVFQLPITFTDFAAYSVRALTLKLNYNTSNLTFIGLTTSSGLTGTTYTSNLEELSFNTSTLNFAWTGAPVNLENEQYTLNFVYNGGGLNDLTLKPGCEIAYYDLAEVVVLNSEFISGSVDQAGVSGYLKYHNIESTVMDNCTVYLMLGSDTISIVSTDDYGYYNISICENGDYTLLFETTKAYQPPDMGDVMTAYAFSQDPGYITDPFLIYAGDVDQSGSVDMSDVMTMYGRPIELEGPYPNGTTWTLPDWVFWGNTFTINGSSVVVNVETLCSGDIEGNVIPN